MKASRQSALEHQLLATEADLRQRLLDVLPRAVSTGEAVFLSGRFLPSNYQESWVSPDGKSLLVAADDCLAQREVLGLPLVGTVGALYLEACEEASDASNHDRRGPRKLAAWLLSQLTVGGPQPNNSLERTREG
jgi:hypothetical protein